MDEQQFTQLMGALDTMLQRQNRMAEHTATVMARLPELISKAGGGSSSSLARNLESAAKILKSLSLLKLLIQVTLQHGLFGGILS